MKAIFEKIPRSSDRSFTTLTIEANRFDCSFHYHPEYELTLIVNSSGHRYVGDHIGRFAAGDLVLMGPNLPHMYVSDAKFPGKAQACVIQFLADGLGAGFFQLGEMKPIRLLLERSRTGLLFHGRVRDKIATAMDRLRGEEGPARIALLLEILATLAASGEYRRMASPSYSPSLALYQGERIDRVCELISKKFRENVTQAEAARVARMSGPSFSRFFRRATNRTFRSFLNQIRIGHASQLLLETDRTVAEICYDSGFSNLSNFNRQFLRLRKMSPRDYRRQAARLQFRPSWKK